MTISSPSGFGAQLNEDICIKDYVAVPETRDGPKRYFDFYNKRRFHQSLDCRTPEAVYAA
ncbi:MAG: hypothetical protein HY547_01255 [Elusimicrobia bacterium]|nr:hypothetical protein [Elusimicrobiota bacterium]